MCSGGWEPGRMTGCTGAAHPGNPGRAPRWWNCARAGGSLRPFSTRVEPSISDAGRAPIRSTWRKRGFLVTGVDFSSVAVEKASVAAASGNLAQPPRFLVADLLKLPADSVGGPFDLLFDGGTLDDFPPTVRPQIASAITNLSRPGSVLVMWCFYAAPKELPRMSFGGASRWGAPPIEPGEEHDLFGVDWDIERYTPTEAGPHDACFVMTRR